MAGYQKSILIIDDDQFLLDMYALKFKEAGFSVRTALSGVDALLQLKKGAPDVILLDIVMPNLDGFALLQKLKEEKLSKDALIIVLSNVSQESDIVRAKELGAIGYLVKASATPGEIVKKVEEYLENK